MMLRGLKAITAITLILVAATTKAANVSVSNNYLVGTVKGSVVVPQAPDVTGPILTNIINKVFNDISGPSGGIYRSPWQWTKSPDGIEYEPFGKFTSVQANSSGDIAFGSDATMLQMAWGSPDGYNKLELIDDGVTVAVVTGSDIVGSNVGVNFVELTLVGAVFDTVRFSSGDNALEIANISIRSSDNLVTSDQFIVAQSHEH
jgi:hypothetical protein